MPGRVNAPMNGSRPEAAVRDVRQADQGAQEAQGAGGGQGNGAANGADRVEISGAARARSDREMALAEVRQEDGGATALETQGARPSEEARPAAVQGDGAATRTAELRQQEDAARQQAANRPQERQGNLVDVTG